MMVNIFKKIKRKNVDIYVDDILAKSKLLEQYILYLKEILITLKKYNISLNPLKCTFEVGSSKFLIYLLMPEGMKINPDKVNTQNIFVKNSQGGATIH